MQFAGQRTDEKLQPIGDADNILIKLSDDVVPEPDAILVHGITPQKTLSDGITEVEFLKYFHERVAMPDTIFIGYNNIRFDDEFTRRICYRNFYDPYQWHWKDGRSRWDLLDAIRMMRALRPDGLNWPIVDDKPTVRLELMAKENGLSHENAHDALSDVIALIELAQKYHKYQPKLFEYLLNMRDKRSVANLVEKGDPFVYTSGRYNSENEKTTVVQTLFKHPRRESGIVYDLREDPSKWVTKTPEELAKHWQARFNEDIEKLPVKTLQYNRCPAIAPTSVLDKESKKRIKLEVNVINKNQKLLLESSELIENIKLALDILEKEQQTRLPVSESVDEQIYDGFWQPADHKELTQVRKSDPSKLSELATTLKNKRIREMIPLYKARNFPKNLTVEEKKWWEDHRYKLLVASGEASPINKALKRIRDIDKTRKLNKNENYLIEELRLYLESILPESLSD